MLTKCHDGIVSLVLGSYFWPIRNNPLYEPYYTSIVHHLAAVYKKAFLLCISFFYVLSESDRESIMRHQVGFTLLLCIQIS